MKKFKRRASIGHISSTSWSLFYTYHISFWSLEFKSPTLQMVCKAELKWRSYGHWKTTAPSWKTISQVAKSQIQLVKIKVQLAKWTISTCEIFASHVSTCKIHLCNPIYLRPTLLDFFFRYFLFKSLFCPYNPPIIRFLS